MITMTSGTVTGASHLPPGDEPIFRPSASTPAAGASASPRPGHRPPAALLAPQPLPPRTAPAAPAAPAATAPTAPRVATDSTARPAGPRPATRRRPSTRAADVAAPLAGLGLGAVVGIGWATREGERLSAATVVTEAGRFAGLVGTYGVLLLLLLVARLPPVERAVGQDRLLRWHRLLAPVALSLVAAHAVLVPLGYGLTDGSNLLGETWTMLRTYPWVLPALVGLVLMVVAAVTSYRRVRTRMAYETWWVIHLYTYLAIALAFLHQLQLGQPFLDHPWARAFWLALYVVTVLPVLLFRFALPVARAVRHDLRVYAVEAESDDTVSVWLTGRGLPALQAKAGQYFAFRFLTRQWWWQAHPYSLSAPPQGDYLRITVRDLGDHSRALRRLRPGTRVVAEGPYGIFTAERRVTDRVVLVAGGVGVGPVRAVLEDLPEAADVDVLYRAPNKRAVVLADELDTLAWSRPSTRVHYLVGSRRRYPMDARSLQRLVPDVTAADVYVCGPAPLVVAVREACAVLGLPAARVHAEEFALTPEVPR